MDKTKQLITSLICALFLAACSNNQQTKNTGKYAPRLNPKPKYFLTIKGQTNKHLHAIIFTAIYATTNQKCNIIINKFEGASASRQTKINYPLPLRQNSYNINIPLDLIQKNLCSWKIQAIRFTYKQNINNNETDIIAFTDKMISEKNKTTTFICNSSQQPNCMTTTKYMIPDLSRSKNHTLTINFTKKPQE
ncbi:MAG: hypothetical protein KAS93_07435 [Gammaproteobacteria bacterium]|nr:hypothetical protein [Gammaproteobacteria bacterium]